MEQAPYDIHYEISNHLDFDSYLNLASTCKSLRTTYTTYDILLVTLMKFLDSKTTYHICAVITIIPVQTYIKIDLIHFFDIRYNIAASYAFNYKDFSLIKTLYPNANDLMINMIEATAFYCCKSGNIDYVETFIEHYKNDSNAIIQGCWGAIYGSKLGVLEKLLLSYPRIKPKEKMRLLGYACFANKAKSIDIIMKLFRGAIPENLKPEKLVFESINVKSYKSVKKLLEYNLDYMFEAIQMCPIENVMEAIRYSGYDAYQLIYKCVDYKNDRKYRAIFYEKTKQRYEKAIFDFLIEYHKGHLNMN